MIQAAVSQVWYDNTPDIQNEYGPFQYGLNHSYLSLLERPGLLPLAILPTIAVSPEEILKNFDILVLTGGGDPSPSLFGREDNGSRNPRPFRSTWDLKLYHAARKLGMPVLGICLGMQLIAIAEGIALIQDIPQTPVFHDGSGSKPATHSVAISTDTLLYDLFGAEITVSSSHHQAIEKVPPGYLLSAKSSDGCIEAIQSKDGLVLGVQWHPERDSTGKPILDALVRMVGAI